jgi:hypothetical protein
MREIMTDNTLAKWQRPGTQAAPAPPKAALAEYKSFREAAPSRLFFKCGPTGSDRAFPYGYLVDVETDNWSIIGLSFALPPWPGPVQVAIRGECLGPVAEAIIGGSCSVVEVFDKRKHTEPPDGSPVVREIVIVNKPPESIGQTKH